MEDTTTSADTPDGFRQAPPPLGDQPEAPRSASAPTDDAPKAGAPAVSPSPKKKDPPMKTGTKSAKPAAKPKKPKKPKSPKRSTKAKAAPKKSKPAAKSAKKKAAPKRVTKNKASGPKKSPAMELAKSVLTKNPKASFAEVKKIGARKRITVIPVVYGRAKLALGIANGAGKTKKPKGRVGRPPKVRLGRPPKARASSGGADNMLEMLSDLRSKAAEADQLRGALDQIKDILSELD